jgi:hypothetical protein
MMRARSGLFWGLRVAALGEFAAFSSRRKDWKSNEGMPVTHILGMKYVRTPDPLFLFFIWTDRKNVQKR